MTFKSNEGKARLKYAACKVNTVERFEDVIRLPEICFINFNFKRSMRFFKSLEIFMS